MVQSDNIKDIITKAKLLGLKIREIPTYYKHNECYLISISETEHIICIPDDVTKLNYENSVSPFTYPIQKIQGTLKIIGGHSLKDASYMFNNCQAQYIDLSSFDTSNVTNMNSIFYKCEAQFIDLSSFNTSKVTNMQSMFYYCKAKSLDLSSFDTSKVTNMQSMFADCQAQSLDLSSFDTRKVTDMYGMFCECQAQFIDLSSFNTSSVTDMNYIFDDCQAKIKATDLKILQKADNRL